jgi:hypothetical protein
MRLDLSVLPVPVVPIHEKLGMGTNSTCEAVDIQGVFASVPSVPAVPIGFEANHTKGLQPVGDLTAAIVTAIATGRALPTEASHQPSRPTPRGDAETEHKCHQCTHWQGVNCYGKGECAAGYRPWRISNIASYPDYYRWHYIGHCAEHQEDNDE